MPKTHVNVCYCLQVALKYVKENVTEKSRLNLCEYVTVISYLFFIENFLKKLLKHQLSEGLI